MKTLAVFAVALVMAAAHPMLRSVAPKDGQFVLTKDFSLEDGHEYSVKYVKPYTPGKPLPIFRHDMDSSEEIRYYLASDQGSKRESWSERVKKLRQVLNTGVDASDEFQQMYATGTSRLPGDRQYYVDSSGEIYYEAEHKNQLTY